MLLALALTACATDDPADPGPPAGTVEVTALESEPTWSDELLRADGWVWFGYEIRAGSDGEIRFDWSDPRQGEGGFIASVSGSLAAARPVTVVFAFEPVAEGAAHERFRVLVEGPLAPGSIRTHRAGAVIQTSQYGKALAAAGSGELPRVLAAPAGYAPEEFVRTPPRVDARFGVGTRHWVSLRLPTREGERAYLNPAAFGTGPLVGGSVPLRLQDGALDAGEADLGSYGLPIWNFTLDYEPSGD